MDDLIENSAKRRRGGIQQRIAKQREDAKQYPSVLAEFLVSQFAWGHFSAQMVQTIAGLAMKDIMKVSDDYEQLDDLIIIQGWIQWCPCKQLSHCSHGPCQIWCQLS